MADPATAQELIDAGKAVLRTELDPEGTGAVNLTDGSDLTLLLSVGGAMANRNRAHLADRAQARYRTSATGNDLRQIARDLWQTDKKPEAFSTVIVYLKRFIASSTHIPAGSRFTVVASATQQAVTFSADADVATAALSVAVPCTCLQAGEIGNVDYDLITKVADDLPDTAWQIFSPDGVSYDSLLAGTLQAPEDAAGGANEETDDELQQRLARLPSDASRRPGMKDGILFGILEVPGVRYCTLVEPADGTILAFIGDAQYGLNQALSDKVSDNLDSGTYSTSGAPGYRGYGLPVHVRPFTTTRVIVTATIYMNQETHNYDLGTLRSNAIANGGTYFADRPFADEYRQNAIESALLACDDDTQDVSLTLSPTQKLRSASSSYSSQTSIVRYFVDEQSWFLSFSGPQSTA